MENLSNMASPEDEAGVRLVDEKNGKPSEKNIEVKYMTPDSQNGDAKIDIENIKSAFAGMGKEELMKYANDPFWIKMRWMLFILFWLVWIAMLAGAIAIIVLAPKCAAPVPREWWEQSPLYLIDVRSFKDGSDPQDGIGDLKGLESKLDYFEKLGVKTVVLSNVLKTDKITDSINGNIGNVVSFNETDERVGTISEFSKLAAKMKGKGLHLLISFIPNHSSDQHPWFLKSVEGETPFKDYYVWAPPNGYDPQDGVTPLPPNNWLSKSGGSAWEWNDKRKMFYLHQFDKSLPEFDFHNQEVVEYFKGVMKFWLENGVSGFHLDKVEYLLEDKELRNESASNNEGGSAVHTDYDFYKHTYTTNVKGLSSVLKQLNEISANNSGIISVTSVNPVAEEIRSPGAITNSEGVKESVISQLFVRPQLLSNKLNATILKTAINSTLQTSSWPTWEFSCKMGTDCISEDLMPGLQVVSLLLPGTPVTKSGSELGVIDANGLMPWDSTTNGGFSTSPTPWKSANSDYYYRNVENQLTTANSQLSVYRKLLETRELPGIMHGETNVTVINDVLTFTRIKLGNPGFLVAFNTLGNSTFVDFTKLKGVPDDVSLIVHSATPGVNITVSPTRSHKLHGDAVEIPGYTAFVMQFVPIKDSN